MDWDGPQNCLRSSNKSTFRQLETDMVSVERLTRFAPLEPEKPADAQVRI